MKDSNKTYAIVEVIDGEKIQLVRSAVQRKGLRLPNL